MDRFLTKKEEERLWQEKTKYKVKCKCGHVTTIINPKGYQLCTWCHNFVFLKPQIEFEYRMKENLIKERRLNK